MSDQIYRQAAIDEIENYPHGCTWNVESMKDMTDRIKALPPAQPTQTDASNTLKALDCVERQAAIDAADRADYTGLTVEDVKKVTDEVVKEIKKLPSAQPEIIYCKKCKHWTETCGDKQWGLGDCDVFEKHLVMCNGYCAWAERRGKMEENDAIDRR